MNKQYVYNDYTERLEFLEKNLKPKCEDAVVWDFCCGTGMNGLTALEWGAKFVHFSDVREKTFIDYKKTLDFNKNLKEIDDTKHSWTFIDTDFIEKNSIDKESLDVIIYHGNLYHARNHFQILKELTETNAKYISFETKGSNSKSSYVEWFTEPTNEWFQTFEKSDRKEVMVGVPTFGWCKNTFEYFGWKIADSKVWYRNDLETYKWRLWLER